MLNITVKYIKLGFRNVLFKVVYVDHKSLFSVKTLANIIVDQNGLIQF